MVETETTLLILSDNPSVVAKEILSLKSLIGYRLRPAQAKRIHDIYFDTSDLALQHRKLGLRIRKVDSTQFITLKGPSGLKKSGILERLEIEDLWSPRSLERIVAEVEKRNLKLAANHLDPYRFNAGSPLDILNELGLKVVQDRTTEREARNITMHEDSENNNLVLAELAVDFVTYHSNYGNVSLYEIEIEAKKDKALSILETISEKLLEIFKGKLVRWRYSKIATGKAIDILLSKRKLDEIFGSDDDKSTLTSKALKKIEEQLEASET